MWLADFLDELSSFPSALHDDCLDALTRALNYARRNSVPFCTLGARRTAKISRVVKYNRVMRRVYGRVRSGEILIFVAFRHAIIGVLSPQKWQFTLLMERQCKGDFAILLLATFFSCRSAEAQQRFCARFAVW